MQNEDAFETALVAALGSRPLSLYFGLLVCLLLLFAGLWWAAHRYTVPRETSRLPPGVALLLRLGAGFAIVVAAAAGFAEIAVELADGRRVGELDQVFSNTVRQNLAAPALQFFGWLTHLGDTVTLTSLCIGVALLLLARGKRLLALGWTLAIAGNSLLNITLKSLFARARPLHDGGPSLEHGFSFPSGHSSGSVVAYGMLAYVLIRLLPPAQAARWGLPLVLAATALAFSIGCSRIFIQVHFATDVMAGFASGLSWLTVCIVSVEWMRQVRRRPV
jgi:membrane-associated phospholipid phosphatase